MKTLYVLATILTLSSCATLMPSAPGVVKTSKSDYDGVKAVTLNPGWAGNLKIGAYKSQKMASNEVYLVVRNDGIKNFDFNHPNFFIKLDGVETKMSPIESNTECEISSSSDVAHCYQTYKTNLNYLKSFLTAKKVKFKLHLRDSFVTGNLDRTGATTAKSGLKVFFEELSKL